MSDKQDTGPGKKQRWPRWDWSGNGAWHVTPRRPCPVCGGHSNCQVSAEGVVCCRRETERPDGAPRPWRTISPLDEAATYEWGHKHGDGRDWVPVDARTGERVRPVERTAEEQAALDAARDADREARRRAVFSEHMRLISAGDGQTEPVEDYLKGRSIDPRWLPGGRTPASWLYFPACPEYWPWNKAVPAVETHRPRSTAGGILAAITAPWRGGGGAAGLKGQYRGAHSTHIVLKDGRWRKRATATTVGGDQPDRIMHGQFEGVVALWGGDTPERGVYPGGVLIIGEGIETTLAVQAACGAGMWTAWAALAANNLVKLRLPRELAELGTDGAPRLHTVIFACDLDKALSSTGKFAKAGQLKGAEAVLAWRERYPWLTVVGRWPGSKWFPELVERVKPSDDEEDRRGQRDGWLGRFWEATFERVPGLARCEEERPIDQARGCDWDDVLAWAVMTGDRAGIAEPLQRVGLAVCEGLDLAGNAERARMMLAAGSAAALLAGAGDGSADPAGDPFAPGPSPDPTNEGQSDANASEAERTRSAGAHGDGGPGGTADAGVGDAGSGGRGGWGPPNYGGLMWFEEFDGQRRAVLGKIAEKRARLFLLQRCIDRGAGERRWRLAYWAGKWYWFDSPPGGYGELDEIELKRMVRRWLLDFFELKRDSAKTGPQYQPVNPSIRTVGEIIEALAGECYVDAPSMPAWLPPSIDEEGVPCWEHSADGGQRVRYKASLLHTQRGPASDYFVDAAGMFRLSALVKMSRERAGRAVTLRRVPHTPELFARATKGYTLDLAVLERAIRYGWTEHDFAGLCPMWGRWLRDVTASDSAGLRSARIKQLGQMFGDTISGDRRIEKVFLVPGPKRGGKGVCEEALAASHGEGSVMPTSFSKLGSNFGLFPLIGYPVGILSDAHVSRYTDGTLAVENLKTISGRGRVTVEAKYGDPFKVVLTCRIWIFSNDEPDKLQDSSGALAGRFLLWPMNVSFFGREDDSVKEGVKAEGAGIAVWALVHYAELFAMARPQIGVTELAEEVSEEIEDQTSVMSAFLRAVVVCDGDEAKGEKRTPRCDVTKYALQSALYKVYVRWCRLNEHRPVGPNKLVGKIRPHVAGIRRSQPELEDGSRPRVVWGIELRSDLPIELTTDPEGSGPGDKRQVTTYGSRDEDVFQPPLPV